MAAQDRIRQLHIFDDTLEFALITLGDLATEDDGNFVSAANHTAGIQCCYAIQQLASRLCASAKSAKSAR
jgi:hypothetical protein